MKSLVLYSSQSGNTKKLADTVYATLPEPKEIFSLDNAPESLADFDLITLGFWFQGGNPDAKSQEYLPAIGDKKLFLFASHGAAPGSEHVKKGMNAARQAASASKIVGTFSCQGEVNPKVIETAKKKPEPPPWIADAPKAQGHPNQEDLASLMENVQGIIATLS